jgi:hypothetical protein
LDAKRSSMARMMSNMRAPTRASNARNPLLLLLLLLLLPLLNCWRSAELKAARRSPKKILVDFLDRVVVIVLSRKSRCVADRHKAVKARRLE